MVGSDKNTERFMNKVEEALQLLSAHMELMERQNSLLRELADRIDRIPASAGTTEYQEHRTSN